MPTPKKAEKQHQEKDRLYRHLVETANAIPWIFDMRTLCFTYVGPQAEAMLGYPAEEWYSEGFWESHIHPDDRSWAIDFCMASAAKCQDHDFEYRMIKADGNLVWIRDSVNVIANEDGPYELRGFMFDITERKKVENSLNKLAEINASHDMQLFYRTCVASLADAYGCQYAFIGLISNEAGTRVQTQSVWAGNDFADNFEYELEGTPCADVLDQTVEIVPRDAAKKYPDDLMLVDMGVESYFGAPLVTSDGRTIGLVSVLDTEPLDIHYWVRPLLGLFAGRIAAEVERHKTMEELEQRVIERTQHLVEAREEAIRANKAKSEFLSRMSHELRTPLNAVLGYAQILELDMEEDNESYKGVKEIIAGGEHLLKLIEEIMDLSRIEMGKMTLKSEKVELPGIVQKALRFIHPLAVQRNITVDHAGADSLCVKADKVRLEEVLLNLLSNAVKYNSEGGQIHVNCSPCKDAKVCISVIDTGPGLNDEQLAILFEPFSRLGAEYSGIEGTGIGLSIVKKLVELMGGEIHVESTVGKGTHFHLYLPRATD